MGRVDEQYYGAKFGTCQYCGAVIMPRSLHSCAAYAAKVASLPAGVPTSAGVAPISTQGIASSQNPPSPPLPPTLLPSAKGSYIDISLSPAHDLCCYCREVPISPTRPEPHVQCCMCQAVLAKRFLDQIYTNSRHDLEAELALLEAASS